MISMISMKNKVFLTLFLLTSAFFAGSPTVAAPDNSAPQPAPSTQPQTTPSQPQSAPSQPSSSSKFLTKADLPSGFQEVPPELKTQVVSQLSGLLQQQLPGANLRQENLFGFYNPETSEVVMGYTDKLPDRPTQTKFDTALKQIQQPDTQQKLLSQLQQKVKTVKDYKVEVVDYKPLPELNSLANSSAGASLSLKVQDQLVHADIVSFRRNAVAAIATVVNLNGQQPALRLSDVARKLDTHITQSASAAHPSVLAQF